MKDSVNFLMVCVLLCGVVLAEEAGPDIVLRAGAKNSQPDVLPTLRVQHEKMWGNYYLMLSATFPNVPDFQCDSWCYESAVDFVDARALDGGAIEFRHRDKNQPQALAVTTVTPEPGAITVEARMVLDKEGHPDAALPVQPTGLNLCWQLRHAKGFSSLPDTYPDFVRRCFIYTEKGRSFLLDLDRRKIPPQPADHEYNNPPWVQSYVGLWQSVPEVGPKSWADYSRDRYTTTLIGAVSRDKKHLTAIGTDSATTLCQAWHDCMHNNPQWAPADAPVTEQRWRLKIYATDNDPEALLERFGKDFPNAPHQKPKATVTAE
jgi:hypothetical protein